MNIRKFIFKILARIFPKRFRTIEIIVSEESAILDEAIESSNLIQSIKVSQFHEERDKLINTLAKQQAAKEFLSVVNISDFTKKSNKNNRKQINLLNEFRSELRRLEEVKIRLVIELDSIQNPNKIDFTFLERRWKSIQDLFGSSAKEQEVFFIDFNKSFHAVTLKQLDQILNERSLVNKFQTREKKVKKFENDFANALNRVDWLIRQNKLTDAKLQLNDISLLIKPGIKKGNRRRVSELLKKLKDKEIEVLKVNQSEILRKQAEEAEAIQLEQEKRVEIYRQEHAQRNLEKRQEEERLIEKQNRLNLLLNKKANWRDIQKILQKNGISVFYHFTDRYNLKSIIDNAGLYSWSFCDNNGIIITFPGGDALSRSLDKKHGLHDYVRASFCSNHPMQYRLQTNGSDLVLLKLDLEVAYFENTLFCNMNATDKMHQLGGDVEDLEKIRFSATKRKYVSSHDPDFKYHQAEILVKTWIPISHVTNIKELANDLH
jgi:ssDNA thymidine ADP-ribosyltransferase, DarT